ncbi:enoyl-CoA delta isomerase 1, mitochondrial [Petromyzon marinus]|uniref:Enoyl-CoA delta isomerase 1, mitochondrial n=2 Tax=Petromyzon marinus TaxID=7757 RepID=A0AAJ7THL0_PETMA|nr:enoyl-CoA delta isomerase 1, mitochondrial [Petromyzon marinus]
MAALLLRTSRGLGACLRVATGCPSPSSCVVAAWSSARWPREGAVAWRTHAQVRHYSSSDKLSIDMDDKTGVAVLKLSNPPVNSLSLELLTELAIGLDKLEMNPSCRGVIMTSAHPHIFSAGLDVSEMMGKPTEHYREFWRAVQEMWLKLYGSSLVTIAAINGSSPAGGCLMAMCCDYRLMADNPKYSIGLNETKLGIVAPFWFRDTMMGVVGTRVTERSLQLGLMYSPAEAVHVGLVDRTVPEETVFEEARTEMARWLKIPDHARQITKSMMRKTTIDHLLAQRDSDISNFANFISKDSIQKSLTAYMQALRQPKK